jgi:hypothetical protein
MSRNSTSTIKTSSSGRPDPSPPVSMPLFSRETTYASQESLPSFDNNLIDDFVLFPEDTGSWNPADMSLSVFDGQGTDLSQFNFDINDIGLGLDDFSTSNHGESFDFSSFEQPSSLQPTSYTPLITDQYGLDKWASSYGGQSVSHSRPHPSASTQDSGQLDLSWYSGDCRCQLNDSPSGQLDLSWSSSGCRCQLNDLPVSTRINIPAPHGFAWNPASHPQLVQGESVQSTSESLPTIAMLLSVRWVGEIQRLLQRKWAGSLVALNRTEDKGIGKVIRHDSPSLIFCRDLTCTRLAVKAVKEKFSPKHEKALGQLGMLQSFINHVSRSVKPFLRASQRYLEAQTPYRYPYDLRCYSSSPIPAYTKSSKRRLTTR